MDYLASGLVRVGLFPCAPISPTVAITTRVLETFRLLYLRCPRMSIQPFVKTLCDLHGVPFRPYLSQQFTICYDLYLEILGNVRRRVRVALGRDGRDWRLTNTCPSCMYTLDDETDIGFGMLFTMDGGDSLKRLERRGDGIDEQGGIAPGLGPSIESIDSRVGGEDYFIPRTEVDEWDKGVLKGRLASEGATDELPSEDPNPCEGRWKNMSYDATSKMWGVFDETGIFVALCRHGFVLLLLDMVKSGELYVASIVLVCYIF